MKTPVALMIFNRPKTTEKVFNKIAKAKPTKLFVNADGPRPDRKDDAELCAAARAIVDRVDWECEILRKYSNINLGLGKSMAAGIAWVFKHVDRAIIMEDDCVPHPTFFRYCEELLERFAEDERVMQISGRRAFFVHDMPSPYSYYLSYTQNCWGWATWARAWKYFDYEIKLWPLLRDTNLLLDILGDRRMAKVMHNIFEHTYNYSDKIKYWAPQMTFAVWAQHGLCIRPSVNLVEYIGLGNDATHPYWADSKDIDFPLQELTFPLQHPPFMVRDKKADQLAFDELLASKRKTLMKLRYTKIRQNLSTVLPHRVRKLIRQYQL